MSKSFLLMRHSYDDHSFIDGKNDTKLTLDGINIAKEASINLKDKINSNNVIIRHSTKLRAKETADIICEYLIMNGFNCKCIPEEGLTELYQGKFNFNKLSHQERIDFLQKCWTDFENCRICGNYYHSFGQNMDKDVILLPGNNHNEWSMKISLGLLNAIDDIENNYQSILIAHRGVIYMIEQLVKYSNGEIFLEDIEKYCTRWMKYCQDYTLNIEDVEKSKILIKQYINVRGKK
jgi:phosphoglycerate mutase family protein